MAAVGLLAWTGSEVWARLVYGVDPSNRFAVYALRRQITPGMPAAEIRELLAAAGNARLDHRWIDETRLSIWTHLSFTRACFLQVQLRDERVVHAAIRADHGEGDRLEDAPPDF
jgi:hypothetical protein